MSRQGDHGVILCEPSEISLCGAGTRDLHVRCGYTQRRRWDRVGMQVDAKCAIVAPAGSEAGTDRFPPLAVLSSDVEYDNVLATCRIDSIPPCSVTCEMSPMDFVTEQLVGKTRAKLRGFRLYAQA